jgi:hypothetical protein
MAPDLLALVRKAVREEVDHVFEQLRMLAPKGRPWLYVTIFIAGSIVGSAALVIWQRRGPAVDPSASGIGIPQLVEQVRSELIEADRQRIRDHQPAIFELRTVDLEVAFVVKRSDKLGSKFSVKVIDLDTAKESSSELTHRMTLHLAIPPTETVTLPKEKP